MTFSKPQEEFVLEGHIQNYSLQLGLANPARPYALSSDLKESWVSSDIRECALAPGTSTLRRCGLLALRITLCKDIDSFRRLLCILSALEEDIAQTNRFPLKSTRYVFRCGNRCQGSAPRGME